MLGMKDYRNKKIEPMKLITAAIAIAQQHTNYESFEIRVHFTPDRLIAGVALGSLSPELYAAIDALVADETALKEAIEYYEKHPTEPFGDPAKERILPDLAKEDRDFVENLWQTVVKQVRVQHPPPVPSSTAELQALVDRQVANRPEFKYLLRCVHSKYGIILRMFEK